MRFRDKPALTERLAAEYVLGTLGGGARRRFATWMRQDAALRLTVAQWEARLSPMAAVVREVAPPARVWSKITAAIQPRIKVQHKPTLWESLAFWRGLGLTASGCAAALLAFVAIRPPQVVEVPKIQIVERQVEKVVERIVEKEMPIRVSDGKNPWQPSYVATLNDAKGKTMLMIYVGRNSDELWMKYEGDSMPKDASLELWGIDAQGKPKSLGVIKTMGKSTMKLPTIADKEIARYKTLAVSMEPMGGSPMDKPTGPVMYKGPCHTLW